MLRRGIGVGAVVRPSGGDSGKHQSSSTANTTTGDHHSSSSSSRATTGDEFGRRLTEQRLTDISQAAEMLESGIRSFVEQHKDEIRNNAFLRDKVSALAESCNVDLGAATSDTPRLKPGALGGLISDALLGGSENSAAMKQFYSFLSSRVVTFCMRERLLRGPVVPMILVLREMRKRYPLEDISAHDIVKSIEFLAPLNPNMFVLSMNEESISASSSTTTKDALEASCENLFVAFTPLENPTSLRHLLLSQSEQRAGLQAKQQQKAAAGLSGSDALRIIVLATDMAKRRKRERDRLLSSSASSSASAAMKFSVGFTTGVAPASSEKASASFVSIETLGIVDGEKRGTFYVKVTVHDILRQLAPTTTTNHHHHHQHPWTAKRARMALKAARSMHDDGWFDSVDRSTWLLVLLA